MSYAGTNDFVSGGTSRAVADLPVYDQSANAAYAVAGNAIRARSVHLARSNAYGRALINAMFAGVVGDAGLAWRSLYETVEGQELTDADRDLRTGLTLRYARAFAHLDVGHGVSLAKWQEDLVYDRAVYGEAIRVRVSKPRPGADHAVRWRRIHPGRVSQPHALISAGTIAPATAARIVDGVQLDQDGDAIGLWISTAHPSDRQRVEQFTHRYVPLVDALGLPSCIWSSTRLEPEQLRAPGWFSPIMTLIGHLGSTAEAHVMAKRMQACIGMVVESPDPIAAAKADQNGEVWTRDTVMRPGKAYYVKPGTRITPFDFKYDGKDFDDFTCAMLQSVCAAFGPGLPWQIVMQQLPRSNMASARAALQQAHRSFKREQAEIAAVLDQVVLNLVAEDLASGTLDLLAGKTMADLRPLAEGFFVPPMRLMADEYREMQAMQLKRETLGISKTTLAREAGGYDLDNERLQAAEDAREDARVGVTAPAPAAAADAADAMDPTDPEPADPADDPAEDAADPNEPADDQDATP